MTCLLSYLSGGSPSAALRALLKPSWRHQPPAPPPPQSHLALAPSAARLAASVASATAASGLPSQLLALAGRGSSPPPPPAPPAPSASQYCLSSDASSELPSRSGGSGFCPSRVVVVAKMTRYEFEQQRYRYAGLSEEDLKQLVSGASRMQETTDIRTKYPSKIPVVLERYQKERTLPQLSRVKFLVSGDLSMSQFVYSVRARLSLTATQAFYLLVDNKSLPSLSMTVSEVYAASKDDDGFLYITYASQNTFGDVGP